MILGVDASRASGQRFGVGRAIEHILDSWARQDLPFDQVRLFSPSPLESVPANGRFVQEVSHSAAPPLWWQTTSLRAKARQVDAFFAPYTLPPWFQGRAVVFNLGIYEGPHAIPGWRARARSRHMAYSARRADLVLANCPTTKADLVSFFGVDPLKIRVLPEGRDPWFRPGQPGEEDLLRRTVTEVLGVDAPYMMFVGKPSLRRHIPELIEGFSLAAPSNELRLLLVGPRTPEVDADHLAARLGVADRVHHVPYIEHDALRLLYRGARAYGMLSEKDGFPTTLLEALGSGCPTLTLRGASLGALEYLNGPRDWASGGPVLEASDVRPASLAKAIERLAMDDDLCAELGRRAQQYAATLPTWDEIAARIMESLAEVAGVAAGEADRTPDMQA
ncbi:MAG: glycosyltransferase [Solirubrobacterales bacterium]